MASVDQPRRPPIDGQLRARATRSTVAAVDAWARANRVTRTEAIRRLIELGLRAAKDGATNA